MSSNALEGPVHRRVNPAAQRPWEPLLRDADAARANHIIDEIAALIAPTTSDAPFHLDGLAGRALFFAYLSEARGDAGSSALVDRHLDHAVETLATADTHAALWSGFVGVAWVSQHVRGRFLDPEHDEDPNAAIDEMLSELLARSPWAGEYDLIGGLAGHCVYGLERLNRPVGRELLAHAVARIAELAQPRAGGITWHQPPERLQPWRLAECPRGLYDLGVAHGVPALITVLAGACAAGVAEGRARALVDGAVRWLLGQRRDGPAAFPSWIHDAGERHARLAWCYGDPGVAVALLAAARAVDEPAWAEAALEIGRRAARRGHDEREAERLGVHDAGLCHGSIGLALLFHRLWQDARDPLFALAAQRWYRRALAQHCPGRGLAGYQSLRFAPGSDPASDEPQWRDDASLLTGIVGIGLGLLAAIGTVEPAWDRLLAASLPPR
jgi:hypothetical protein